MTNLIYFKIWILGLCGCLLVLAPSAALWLSGFALLIWCGGSFWPSTVVLLFAAVSFVSLENQKPQEIGKAYDFSEWEVRKSFRFSSEIFPLEKPQCRALLNRSLPQGKRISENLRVLPWQSIERVRVGSDEMFLHQRWPCGRRAYPFSPGFKSADLRASERWREAIFFGNRQSFDRSFWSAVNYLGVTHLFVFSAFHLGLYFLFLSLSLSVVFRLLPSTSFFRSHSHWLYSLCQIFGLFLFISWQPDGIALKRCAGVLILSVVASKLLPFLQRYSRSEKLSALASLFLLVDPFLSLHLGYLLSFGVTWTLLQTRREEGDFVEWKSGFAAVIMSQLILFFLFQETSLWSWIANMILGCLFVFVAVPALFIPGVFSDSLFEALEALIRWMEWVAQNWKWVPSLSAWSLSLSLICLVCGLFQEKPRIRTSFFVGSFFLLFFSPISFVVDQFSSRTVRLDVLDVGQGDGFLVRWENQVVLIDGGRDPRMIEKLRAHQVRRIDVWVLTHFDADHYDFFLSYRKAFQVKELWIPRWDSSHKSSLVREASGNNLLVRKLEWWGPAELSHQGVSFKCLGLPSSLFEVKNNDSLACQLRRDGRLLVQFSGDLEASGERRHLARGLPVDKGVDVLIAGHHGSRTSATEEWIEAYRPRYAVISSGRNNRYRHPHPYVLDRLKRWGATIRMTSALGDIQFVWDQGFVE